MERPKDTSRSIMPEFRLFKPKERLNQVGRVAKSIAVSFAHFMIQGPTAPIYTSNHYHPEHYHGAEDTLSSIQADQQRFNEQLQLDGMEYLDGTEFAPQD